MHIRTNASLPMQLSFDEAAEREYVNEDMARVGAAPGRSNAIDDGSQTPVRNLDDAEINKMVQETK